MGGSHRTLQAGTLVAALACVSSPASAITIVGVPLGGTPATSTGGGTLDALFEAAADLWEGAILDDHVFTVFYGWAPLGPEFGAFAGLQHEADGRATGGSFVVNNASFTSWYVDATPDADEEFGAFAESRADLGGGSMNVGRTFEAVAPDAVGHWDLFSVVLHEMGHTLGLTEGFTGYPHEVGDGDVDVTPPLPFAGASIPIYHHNDFHTDLPDAAMNDLFVRGERRLLTDADILAVAQVNGFTEVDLALARVPEPGTILAIGAGLGVLGLRAHRAREGR